MFESRIGLPIILTFFLFVGGVSTTHAQTIRTRSKSINSQNIRKQEVQKKQTVNNNQDLGLFTFVGPDDDFSVKTPVKFKFLSSKPNNLTSARLYGGSNDEVTLSIVLQEMDFASDNPYNNEFAPDYERMTAKLFLEKGSKVISFRRVVPNVVDWEHWHPAERSGEWRNTLERQVINNGRLYSLSCGSALNNQEVNKNLCKTYFNSFKLLD